MGYPVLFFTGGIGYPVLFFTGGMGYPALFFTGGMGSVSYTHLTLIYRCDCDRRRIASKTRGQKRSLFKIFENSKIEHIRMTGTKIQVVVELSGKEMVKK